MSLRKEGSRTGISHAALVVVAVLVVVHDAHFSAGAERHSSTILVWFARYCILYQDYSEEIACTLYMAWHITIWAALCTQEEANEMKEKACAQSYHLCSGRCCKVRSRNRSSFHTLYKADRIFLSWIRARYCLDHILLWSTLWRRNVACHNPSGQHRLGTWLVNMHTKENMYFVN